MEMESRHGRRELESADSDARNSGTQRDFHCSGCAAERPADGRNTLEMRAVSPIRER